jgi:hypothetical protein
MANFKALHDLYRFPGFTPLATIRGRFGDPLAVVISLQRRGKKRFAAFAVAPITAITINDPGISAISPVATSACFCFCGCEGCNAPSVAV